VEMALSNTCDVVLYVRVIALIPTLYMYMFLFPTEYMFYFLLILIACVLERLFPKLRADPRLTLWTIWLSGNKQEAFDDEAPPEYVLSSYDDETGVRRTKTLINSTLEKIRKKFNTLQEFHDAEPELFEIIVTPTPPHSLHATPVASNTPKASPPPSPTAEQTQQIYAALSMPQVQTNTATRPLSQRVEKPKPPGRILSHEHQRNLRGRYYANRNFDENNNNAPNRRQRRAHLQSTANTTSSASTTSLNNATSSTGASLNNATSSSIGAPFKSDHVVQQTAEYNPMTHILGDLLRQANAEELAHDTPLEEISMLNTVYPTIAHLIDRPVFMINGTQSSILSTQYTLDLKEGNLWTRDELSMVHYMIDNLDSRLHMTVERLTLIAALKIG